MTSPRSSALALFVLAGCGAAVLPPAAAAPATEVAAAESAAPDVEEPAPVEGETVVTIDPAIAGDWIAEGDVYSALYAEVRLRAGEIAIDLRSGLPAHASGAPFCDAAGPIADPLVLPCSTDEGEPAVGQVALRLAPDRAHLELVLEGAGWTELGLAPGPVVLRVIDALEEQVWVDYSDVAHEAGETGTEIPPDVDPVATIAQLHRALAAAGVDRRALTSASALAVSDLPLDLAARSELCARERCPCTRDAGALDAALVEALAPFRDAPAAIGLTEGVLADPRSLDRYLRIEMREGRAHGVLVRFPSTVLCSAPLTSAGDEITMACEGSDPLVFRGEGSAIVIVSGLPRVAAGTRWTRSPEAELVSTERRESAPEGIERQRASGAGNVALTLRRRLHFPDPRSRAAAERDHARALEAILGEAACATAIDAACQLAAYRALERRAARDRALRCELLE